MTVDPRELPDDVPQGRVLSLPSRSAPRPEARWVPWEGCPLFPVDLVEQVPEGARLAVRLGVYDGTDEAWFQQRFPVTLEPAAIVERWGGPVGRLRYVATLWTLRETTGGFERPLKQRVLDEIPADPRAIGDEPWPVELARASQAVRDEISRRNELRAAARAPAPPPPAGWEWGQQPPAVAAAPEADEDPPPFPPPPGFAWKRWRGSWIQAPDPSAAAPLAPARSLLADLGRLVAAAGGLPALLTLGAEFAAKREATRAAEAERERERMRLDFEQRQREADRQHALLLAQLQARPAAPAVDAEGIAAKIKAEMLAHRIEELQAEVRAARSRTKPDEDPLVSLRKNHEVLRETMRALGIKTSSENVAAAQEAAESGWERFGAFVLGALDTKGGAALAERLAGPLGSVVTDIASEMERKRSTAPAPPALEPPRPETTAAPAPAPETSETHPAPEAHQDPTDTTDAGPDEGPEDETP